MVTPVFPDEYLPCIRREFWHLLPFALCSTKWLQISLYADMTGDPTVQHEALKSLGERGQAEDISDKFQLLENRSGSSILPGADRHKHSSILSRERQQSQVETYGDGVYPRHGGLPTPPGPPGEPCLPIRQTPSPEGSAWFYWPVLPAFEVLGGAD